MIYLVEIILLINFIVIKKIKRAKINIAIKKDRSKTTTATKKNTYNIIIKENNNNNNKTRIAIYVNSKLIDLTKL